MDPDRAPVAVDAVLPPLFARWMGGLLPGPIPVERQATCDRCAMVEPAADTPRESEYFFSPTTKCCTFLPEISNFLVGRVLSDSDPDAAAGRATLEARIDKRVGVTPLGLLRTPIYSLLYRSSPSSFGQANSMRCPHYLEEQGGRCGVWKSREATCATWFCKYGRGLTGRLFWQRLHDTLAMVEDILRTHCLMEAGLDDRTLRQLFPPRAIASLAARQDGVSPEDVDGRPDADSYRAYWGKFDGRERELYVRCAEIAAPLVWSDIAVLGGTRLKVVARLLVEAYEKLVSTDVPERVRHRQLNVIYQSPDTAHLVGYSKFDPLRVPKALVDVLYRFDGGPTAEALDAIETTHGLRLTPGVVRKLVDFEILSEQPEREKDQP